MYAIDQVIGTLKFLKRSKKSKLNAYSLNIVEQVCEMLQEISDGAVLWSVEDFLSRAEERGVVMSDEQARCALRDMVYHHDASVGISWDTLDWYIDEHTKPEEE